MAIIIFNLLVFCMIFRFALFTMVTIFSTMAILLVYFATAFVAYTCFAFVANFKLLEINK